MNVNSSYGKHFIANFAHIMPVISMFYGIIVRLFFMDNKEHKLPNIHIEYAELRAVVGIPECKILAGNFPNDKLKLVADGWKFAKMN
ncbi:MAG TPA: DUF4160 domain-containing protein [Bacteroidia bacterium]|jgi:hypothetical protein|nr:DUF4160 domain-containing protein [Bacteroidia bacterium]